MALDFRSGRSRLGSKTGGLSGPAIKPITLRLVWETKKAVKSPIIGLGGVETAEDVLEYLSVGASAVQVGTASFADPRASERLVDALANVLIDAKIFSVNKLRDRPLAEDG
jgi:dihydroorotate dehydrogenase (NAD+) catalytic subunit